MRSDGPEGSPSIAIMTADSPGDDALPVEDGISVTNKVQYVCGLNDNNGNDDISRETPTFAAPWSDDNQESGRHIQPAASSGDSPLSDQDDFAIRSPLSLGTSDIRRKGSTIASPPEIHSSTTITTSLQHPLGTRSLTASGANLSNQDGGHTIPASTTLSSTLANANIVPTESGLELLRHYRYNVAPWVSINLKIPIGSTSLSSNGKLKSLISVI